MKLITKFKMPPLHVLNTHLKKAKFICALVSAFFVILSFAVKEDYRASYAGKIMALAK